MENHERETEKWLSEKLAAYEGQPQETIEDMLITTTDVIQQYLQNPSSRACKGLLESCMKHNQLFIYKIQRETK